MELPRIGLIKLVKDTIRNNIDDARFGIFDCRNVVGDEMENLFHSYSVDVDICRDWEYFEVLGLTAEEFEEVCKYYYELLENLEEN